MRVSKKILTIILSISLLVVISCGDKPTESGEGKIPSEYNGRVYKAKHTVATGWAVYYSWLRIENGGIYFVQKVSSDAPVDLEEFKNQGKYMSSFEVSGNTYTYQDERTYAFDFYSDTEVKLQISDSKSHATIDFIKQ